MKATSVSMRSWIFLFVFKIPNREKRIILRRSLLKKNQNFYDKCNRLWELCKKCYDKFGAKPEDPCWELGEFDPFFAWSCCQYEDLPIVI
jgi:hypothetical protein